jgi:hypothetical protein
MSRNRNPVAVAMRKRHHNAQTKMKDRRDRRSKDARRSWKREVWQ